MSYQKIGFNVGVGGVKQGLGDYMSRLDAAGIPFVLRVTNDAGLAMEGARYAQKSGVPHVVVFRYTNPGPERHHDIPDYGKSPEAAAEEFVDRLDWSFARSPELHDLKELFWFEVGNEMRTMNDPGSPNWGGLHAADWLGQFGFHACSRLLRQGFRCQFGSFNAGTPEPEDWLRPGMEQLLRLCGANQNRCGISLHEGVVVGGVDASPWEGRNAFVNGRFARLFEAADQLGVPRPLVVISEWAWSYRDMPGTGKADQDCRQLTQQYTSQYPELLGIALWTMTGGPEWGPQLPNKLNHFMRTMVIDQMLAGGVPASPRVTDGPVTIPTTATGGDQTTGARPAPGLPGLPGIQALSFRLDDDADFRVNRPVWFSFRLGNTAGRPVGYGGLGCMAYRLEDGAWRPYYWQNSWGGNNDQLPLDGLEWRDHIELGAEGTFALVLGITADEDAGRKRDRPADIRDLHHPLPPVFVTIGPHFAPGRVLDETPAPFESRAPVVEGSAGAAPADEARGTPDRDAGATPPALPEAGVVVYLLRPFDLSPAEAQQVERWARSGLTLPDGRRTGGRHTVTYSHIDALRNVAQGAPGSLLVVVAGDRIGSGLDARWIAQNAPYVRERVVFVSP